MAGRSVLVLGGGMCGVGVAWHLLQRGFEVTLVDRRGPGEETSYGNACLIQRECVEPHEFPHDIRMLARIGLGRDNSATYHWDAMPGLVRPLARYWLNSRPGRYRSIVRSYEALIRHCLSEHAPMIEAAGAEDLLARVGFKQLIPTEADFDAQTTSARRLQREFGVNSVALDADALAASEPALRVRMAGAIHWTDPWLVRDPGELVKRYAALFEREGGKIVQGDAMTLARKGASWTVGTDAGSIDASSAVIALGPWSDQLMTKLGYGYPLFIKRGYHLHYKPDVPLNTPVMDPVAGMVVVPAKRGTRVTTGAEFAKLGAAPSSRQLVGAEARARELFDLGRAVEDAPWLGNRPCTPDMLPVVGAAASHPGLWLHFGHAHQGFTLGPATGRLLAEMMNGETPYIDPHPYTPSRF